jgi:hypothetical protein
LSWSIVLPISRTRARSIRPSTKASHVVGDWSRTVPANESRYCTCPSLMAEASAIVNATDPRSTCFRIGDSSDAAIRSSSASR